MALGPGKRFALWVQGCPFRCHGCIAPEWQPLDGGYISTIEEISEKILNSNNISGITISGGEPFLQASALTQMLKIVLEERPELTVICFTGFTFEDLLKNPPHQDFKEFLDCIDLLIDGPYVEALDEGIGLRGSSNQNFIFLSERLKGFDFRNWKRHSEIFIVDESILFVGIPGEKTRSVMVQNFMNF